MEKVAIDDVENSLQPAAVMRHLTEPLGLADFAMNYYELEPGDSFAFAYHRHEVQEEVFYVQSGTATFQTEAGEIEVSSGEIVRFAPGEFQRGWNRGDEQVIALAFGAPLKYGEQVKLRECPTCGEATDNEIERRSAADASGGEVAVTICKNCGTETGKWTKGSMSGEVP
ncbi:cupin domain-containing protein [Halorussus sp. AFM4]|uniref:cupin domain-containing protein n=1 Tax=Halorussus sp. AFM4 TaxID=3421651 RepID=UPI003EBE6BD6